MKVKCLFIGKTEESWLREGADIYLRRLRHYTTLEWAELPALKQAGRMPEAEQKKAEGELLLKQIEPGDRLVLLDERGKEFSSEQFSAWMQQQMNSGLRRLVFAVGGPYGFSEAVYQRADARIALSQMTFSHQMVRVFFAEQLYRAFTILKGESYHHK